MIRPTTLLLMCFISFSAHAGGNGTILTPVIIEATQCTNNSDCEGLLKLPQAVKTGCVLNKKINKKQCTVLFGSCMNFPGYQGKWDETTKKCDFVLVMPNNGLICYSDADCGAGGGMAEYNDTLVTFGAGCVPVPDANFGICTNVVTDAHCCAWGMDTEGLCNPQPPD